MMNPFYVLPLILCAGPFGCASYQSVLDGDLNETSARRIADDLVAVLARTNELPPATEGICMARGAASHFDRAIETSLRSAGYSLTIELPPRFVDRDGMPETNCLVYRANVQPGLSANRTYGTFCLQWQRASLCREYQIPDGKPASAVSISALTIKPIPAVATGPATATVCEQGQLLRQNELPVQPGEENPRINQMHEDIAQAFRLPTECLMVISQKDAASLAQAVRTERSLRHHGVPAANIFRRVEPATAATLDPTVKIEVRALPSGGTSG